MGHIFYDGHILETDNYEDGYSGVRAIEKYEAEQRATILKHAVPLNHFEMNVRRIVTEILVEQGLIDPSKVYIDADEHEAEKWKQIREYIGVEE